MRYSFNVVAPIQSISPLANIGLSILPASRDPSALPAPTIKWISSMKRMILPSDSLILFKTAFNLSSNSPRYFAPAIKAPISSSYINLSFKELGTSCLTIRSAKPSRIAVLPTPGSPIRMTLFLLFLARI